MKRRGFTMWQLLGSLAAISLVGAFAMFALFLHLANQSEWAKRPSCQTNLKRISLAIKQYLQDSDEKWPPSVVQNPPPRKDGAYGWADVIQPHLNSTEVFECPVQSNPAILHDPLKKGYTDYWYNRRMANRNENDITDAASIITLGDGNDGTDATNARYSLRTLPNAWRTDKNSPAYRHIEGANYAFADGHVKWLKPEKVTDAKPNGSNYTFAIR